MKTLQINNLKSFMKNKDKIITRKNIGRINGMVLKNKQKKMTWGINMKIMQKFNKKINLNNGKLFY
jgi:hypothetical protein